jgi:signal transduction histidine kinase
VRIASLASFARAHADAVAALLLTAAYLVEVVVLRPVRVTGPALAEVETSEALALVGGAAFLLSLAARTRLPLLPLGLAFVALVLAGSALLTDSLVLLAGLALVTYSVGAWATGRAGLVGALGVGGLAGLAVVRAPVDVPGPREVAVASLLLAGPWLLGVAARGIRMERGDARVLRGAGGWEAPSAVLDEPGRDDLARELRDGVERSMTGLVMQARAAQGLLERDPRAARRALRDIEATGSEVLSETQRIIGLMLSPDGTPHLEPLPSLADLDYLVEQVTAAGLPVDMRVEGPPLRLVPELDAVAYQVVHEALMHTLEHAGPARASVVVRFEPDELRIEVADDGLGRDDSDAEEEVAGLAAARRAVVSLGGTLDAGPGEKRGYWVVARLPLEMDWD